jgi:hypothetical protein
MKLMNTCAVLGTLLCSYPALASDLPKEGSYSGIFSAYDSTKPLFMGKDRSLILFEANGISFGKGIIDHLTWHCFGIIDVVSGVGQNKGYCIGTDPGSDHIIFEFLTDKFPFPSDKPLNVTVKITSGTGKYTGITGGHTYTYEGNTSKTETDGTFFDHGPIEGGNYKLP